jgi:hypothetical protein
MKVRIASVALMLLLTHSSWSETAMMKKEKIGGPELKAAAIVLERFRTQESRSDLANFAMSIQEYPDAFEVVLVPVPITDHPYPRGGATEFGREVHYTVSKDKYGQI